MAQTERGECDECGSKFVRTASRMDGLCAECATVLYSYPPCAHQFDGGSCLRCGWDGSRSAYTANLTRPEAE